MVALPPSRDALVVVALELGLGALPVLAGADLVLFVRVVSAVVFKIAKPASKTNE